MTGRIDEFSEEVSLAIALRTSTKTRIGAMPFNAPTNSLPKIASTGIVCGTATAKTMPMTRPHAISAIRGFFTYQFTIGFNLKTPLYIVYQTPFSILNTLKKDKGRKI